MVPIGDELGDRLLVSEVGQIDSVILGDAADIDVTVVGVHHPVSLNYDASEERVIFTDNQQHVVASKLLNGSEGIRNLTDTEPHSPMGVAFDWISRLVIFSDLNYQVIVICTPDGRYTKPVVFTSPSQPGAVVVDPQKGLAHRHRHCCLCLALQHSCWLLL